MATKNQEQKKILAIKVHQWIEEWEKVDFRSDPNKNRPEPHFYIFSLSANELKALSGIYRRPTDDGLNRESNFNIQRRHNKARSMEIRRFVDYGYPLSEVSVNQKKNLDVNNLRKPGWLPTSIVINILTGEDSRQGEKIAEEDLIRISDNEDNTANIILPKSFKNNRWQPTNIFPIEIIDGQHRLWAFDDGTVHGKFELPVVAFHGLGIGWQAYLFWVINIKPKRINTSLAFDLYPLLRTADWLEQFEGPKIYRETRAQEITEILWSYPKSAWYQRIDMMGEHRQTMVSQAAWINSLLNTFIKPWEGRGVRIGGLYGAPIGKNEIVLGWSRTQQAAFLIYIWNSLRDAVKENKSNWAIEIRSNKPPNLFGDDPAFLSSDSLLNTDQGVRGFLAITNDLSYLAAAKDMLHLDEWKFDEFDEIDTDTNSVNLKVVKKAMESLIYEKEIITFIDKITKRLSDFDWRTASALNLTDEQKMLKLVFRGSGGYREIRRQLLKHLMTGDDEISLTAEEAFNVGGFNL